MRGCPQIRCTIITTGYRTKGSSYRRIIAQAFVGELRIRFGVNRDSTPGNVLDGSIPFFDQGDAVTDTYDAKLPNVCRPVGEKGVLSG